MAKLKNPLLSLRASGSVSRVLTFLRRRNVDLVEKKPELIDAHTSTQLAWRHMFTKCVDLWHELSAAEKAEWESAARSRHMTGYAWYISQCLRPNPGIYLPLQGGTMSGDIKIDGNRLLKLPAPVYVDEPARKHDVDTLEARFKIGARVYHSVNQAIPHATYVDLAFDSQRYDTASLHSTVTNPSRLTCRIAGKYIISLMVTWSTSAVGNRMLLLVLNNTTKIAGFQDSAATIAEHTMFVTTIYNLALNDYVEARVRHTAGAPLNILVIPIISPEFMMQRIG